MIIGEDALSAINGYCHGNPRIIDNVMTDALILGAELGRNCIDSEVNLSAVKEQMLTYNTNYHKGHGFVKAFSKPLEFSGLEKATTFRRPCRHFNVVPSKIRR